MGGCRILFTYVISVFVRVNPWLTVFSRLMRDRSRQGLLRGAARQRKKEPPENNSAARGFGLKAR
jgi:hypothetical protein